MVELDCLSRKQFFENLPRESAGKFSIVSTRIGNQNIVHRLHCREICQMKPRTPWHTARLFYKNVFPNFTVVNVENPPCFLRKFSPNGRQLLAFSADQTSVEIYEFQGCESGSNLLASVGGDVMHDRSNRLHEPEKYDFYNKVKERLFFKFFRRSHLVPVAPVGEHLNRECSLFLEDSRYVIVSSACPARQDFHLGFADIFTNNESISPNLTNSRLFLENYSIHVVDITAGVLCCSKRFPCDKIFLAHNQGLYLYHNLLAVLSVQHQTIYIYQITEEGKLVEMHVIGRFCFQDDLLTISSVADICPQAHEILSNPYYENAINSLKHRILVHLFKQAQHGGIDKVRRFHRLFNYFCSLRMWRMQLLDENHLLIKYASEGVVSMRVMEPGAQPSFFVTYRISEAKVLAVHENTSCDLLLAYEKYPELFRPPCSPSDRPDASDPGGSWQHQASTAVNVHTMKIQRRFKETIINAKYGGRTEAVKRLLAQLPVPAQSHSSSPYFDLSLFSYDDKWISALERPRTCGDHPIRFYDRSTGLLRFRIYAGFGAHSSAVVKRLVAFTFHPFQPFAISVQRFNNEYAVNFHFRHVKCID